jgi:hypothetical protein
MTGLNTGGDDLAALVLYDEVNIAAMANFLAAMIVTASTDCCHKNYYAYRTRGHGPVVVHDLGPGPELRVATGRATTSTTACTRRTPCSSGAIAA